jgi:hypothetical protein
MPWQARHGERRASLALCGNRLLGEGLLSGRKQVPDGKCNGHGAARWRGNRSRLPVLNFRSSSPPMAAWKCSAVSHSAISMKLNPGARGECPAQARGDEAGLAAHVPRRLVPQGQRLPFPPLGDLEGVDQDHPAHRGCSLHRLAGGRGFRAPSAALASACSTHSPTVSPAAEAASSTAWRVRSLTPLIAHVLALGLAMAPLVAPATAHGRACRGPVYARTGDGGRGLHLQTRFLAAEPSGRFRAEDRRDPLPTRAGDQRATGDVAHGAERPEPLDRARRRPCPVSPKTRRRAADGGSPKDGGREEMTEATPDPGAAPSC